MKLLISIEYRTRWGEQLVMRIGKRRIALQYADGGVWTGAIERYTQSEDTEYRYEIERDGACIRSEWRPHTLRLPAREGVRTLRIRDRWQEMPYTVALADKGWQKACKDDPALALGLNVVEGKVTYKAVADVFGLEYEPIEW